jgi:magnesium chelatase accessory protein
MLVPLPAPCGGLAATPEQAPELRDWPHGEASRFVSAGGVRWHVQQFGSGPVALLVHGTGAACHSWRGLAPLLARHFTVVAPDMPGHGLTRVVRDTRLSLPAIATAFAALGETLAVSPALAIGHSAGAAVLARMCLDRSLSPGLLVSLNGALLPLRGVAGVLFPPLARVLARAPLVPRVVNALAADPAAVERLIRSTGTQPDAAGIAHYGRLIRSPGHVEATLRMMAAWDLRPLVRELPRLAVPLLLVAGGRDRTVPPSEAGRVAALVPGARTVVLPGLGHLAHEEAPEVVARIILDAGREAGVPST